MRRVIPLCALLSFSALLCAQTSTTPSASQAQEALDVLMKRIAVDPSVVVPGTGKPIAVNGHWAARTQRSDSCPKADIPCVTMVYSVPEANVNCEWVVLLRGSDEKDVVLETSDDAGRYFAPKKDPDAFRLGLRKTQQPIYPPGAKASHLTGQVKLSVMISAQGEVEKATVLAGPEIFRRPALTAVRDWEFLPLMIDGTAVAHQTIVTMQFLER